MFSFVSFAFWVVFIGYIVLEIIMGFKDSRRTVGEFAIDKDFIRTVYTVGVIVFLVFSLFMMFKTEEIKEVSEITIEKGILGLSDNYDRVKEAKIAGNILFTYGEIREGKDVYYRLMTGDDVEGYIIKDIKINDNTKLFFDDSGKVVYHYKIITVNEIPNWYYGKIFKNNNLNKSEASKKLVRTDLHIPKNALKIDFTIDMK